MADMENVLKLYSVELNEFMGVIEIKSESESGGVMSSRETIVLLDQSGSMEDVVDKIPTVLADAFTSLGYHNQETINLITFNSKTQHLAVGVSELKNLKFVAEGKSVMSPAVRKVAEVVRSFSSNEFLRLLVISDGEISDQNDTKFAIQELADLVRKSKLKINLQILKLVSDENASDSEVLNDFATKINCVEKTQILPTSIYEQSPALSMRISSLFNDKSSTVYELTCAKKSMLEFPWGGILSDHIYLQSGKNIFWVQGLTPSPNDFKLNGQKIKTMIEPPMNVNNFQSLLEENFSYIAKELCKISIEEFVSITKQVREYFEYREEIFIEKYERTEKNKFTKILSKIVDDDTIKNMSMEEKADYLRKTEFYKKREAKKRADEKANIKLHPVDDNELIATVNLDAKNHGVDAIQTIVILDRSLSMGDSCRRLTNDVIPTVLKKLSYDDKKIIHLVTFDSIGDSFTASVNQLRTLPISCRGCTNMATAVIIVHETFKNLDPSKPVRLLTISDGIIDDREETEKAAIELYNYLEGRNFSINSQAVRFFTSANQPDTTALCSLLRLNNVTKSQLLDICVRDDGEQTAIKIAELFDDGFCGSQVLKSKEKNLMKNPWDREPTDSLRLMPGENVFWVLGIPQEEFELEDEIIEKAMQPQLSIAEFQIIMEEKLEHIIDHMKILKIIETTEASETISRILRYFMTREEELFIRCPPLRKVAKLFEENITKKESYQTTGANGKSKIIRSLKVYPLKENEFLATIENEGQTTPDGIETIIVLDRSGSMEDAVEKVLNEIIPSTLEKLSYDDEQIIHVIAFNERALLYPLTSEQMRSFPLVARGKSFITKAIENLSQLLATFKVGSSLRVLTISDGKATDRDEVEKASQKLIDAASSRNLSINSQVVRVFTSDYLPDKSSLVAMLQINNSCQPWILDISTSESTDEVSSKIVKIFESDNLGAKKTMKSDTKNILHLPWECNACDEILLRSGKNLLWFNSIPKNLTIDGEKVVIDVQPPLDLTLFQSLMEAELHVLEQQMNYFKEMKSKEGNESVRKMLKYFQATEDYLISKSSNRKITNFLSQMSIDKN